MRDSILWAGALCAVLAIPACKQSNANQKSSSTAKSAAPAPASASAAAAAPTPAPKASAKPAPSASAAAGGAAAVELKIASVGNNMKYDKTALTVKTGERVKVTFHNNSKLAVLPHNWVLVKPKTQAKVAAAGLKKGKAAGYIDSSDTDIIAHTPLAEMGKTVSVTFTAPAPGKYPYICTVPGHYVVMHGVLTVTK